MAGIASGLGILVLGFAIGTADPDESAFRERASRFAERHRFELGEGTTIRGVLDGEFVRLSIGLIEMRFPASVLTVGGSNGDLSSIALDLVDLQGEWIVWMSQEGALPPGWKKLQKVLAGWISDWKKHVGTDPRSLRGRDLLEVGATDEVRSASRAIASMAAEGLGAAGELPRASFVFLPTREDFVEFAALVGLLETRHRPYFWIDALALWTEFDFDGTRVLPLEFASPDSTTDYRRAIPMNARNPKGMREQVEQVVLRSLLVKVFDGRLDPAFAASLANNLIIMHHGEVDTRSDGDLTSRTTAETSVFVPGGIDGGILPVNSADSRWRALKGKDHFIGVLAQAQQDAAEKTRERSERILGFLLRGNAEEATALARAPFFGPGATESPEAAFVGDYLEFLRAYRVAFVHWLREEAAPSAKESRRRFAEFLSALYAGETDLLSSFERIYGRPLSTSEPRTLDTSLEGAFLLWLSRR